MKLHRSSDSIAIAVASALATLYTLPAGAAETETASDSLSEVVVTGSRIRGIEPVGSNVVALERTAITEQTGKTAMEIVSTLPQLLNFGVSEQTTTSTSGTANVTRSSAINLHGINQAATLVLVNGRRGPPMGTNGGFTDPSYLPTIALERVEVIADGASGIYGADAVAGVVNFMTRTKFEGFETRVRRGWADGYIADQIGVIGGHSWGSGRAMLAYEHIENTALSGLERDFVRADLRSEGGRDYRVSTCVPGNIRVGNVSYAIPASGVTPATAAQLVPNTRNLCEPFRNFDFLVAQERDSFHAHVEQDVGERITLYAEGTYSNRDYEHDHSISGSSTQVATLSVPTTNAFFVRPPGTTGAVTVEYDFNQDYGRLFHAGGYVRTQSGTAGATFDLGGDWQADLSYTQAKDRDFFRAPVVNATALTAALASSNPATAFNPFQPGTSSQAVYDSIFNGIFQPEGLNRLSLYELRADGPLFALPAGDVRVAVGGAYQEVSTWSPTYRGTTTSLTGPVTQADRTIKSGYAELFVPIVGAAQRVPGIDKLDLSIAGRLDDYSDVGRTENPKIGFTWGIVPTLSVKGSYGNSFRAPNLADLSLSRPGTGVVFSQFPDAGGASVSGMSVGAGNPELEPETATTWSLGVDFQPDFLAGGKLSAQYWNIDFKNQVVAFTSVNTVLTDPAFAYRVTRNPTQAQIDAILNSGIPVTGVRPPVISFIVDGRPRNQGDTQASGVDVEASYRFAFENAGDLRLSLVGTRFLNFETKLSPTDPFIDRLDTINNPPAVRMRASAGWRKGSVGATLFANYVGAYTNTSVTPREEVDSNATFDLHFDYAPNALVPKWAGDAELMLALDVSNVLDEEPPFVNVQGGYDPVQASMLGRLVSLTLGLRW